MNSNSDQHCGKDKGVAKVVGGRRQAEGNEAVFVGDVLDNEGMDNELFGEARSGEGVGEVQDFDEEPEEDAEPKKVSADPGQPTQAEIDDHNVDHYPFRCWCEACVKGRGTGEAHKGSSESAVPVIAFDYLFITKEQSDLRTRHS